MLTDNNGDTVPAEGVIATLRSELEAVRKERDDAVKLLRPFAEYAPAMKAYAGGLKIGYDYQTSPTVDDCRRAASFLTTHDAARAGRGEGGE